MQKSGVDHVQPMNRRGRTCCMKLLPRRHPLGRLGSFGCRCRAGCSNTMENILDFMLMFPSSKGALMLTRWTKSSVNWAVMYAQSQHAGSL